MIPYLVSWQKYRKRNPLFSNSHQQMSIIIDNSDHDYNSIAIIMNSAVGDPTDPKGTLRPNLPPESAIDIKFKPLEEKEDKKRQHVAAYLEVVSKPFFYHDVKVINPYAARTVDPPCSLAFAAFCYAHLCLFIACIRLSQKFFRNMWYNDMLTVQRHYCYNQGLLYTTL